MPNVKLDHCVIHVSDWERANAFYRDVMGAELIRRGNGWAYRFGAQQLNCHGPGVDAHPVARLPVAPGNSDLCFVWPGAIEGAVAHLARHGVAACAARGARCGDERLLPRPRRLAAGVHLVRLRRGW
jgi:catechol 2,3-dioxygenase-like lactoylglutathione lyase family enzyme